MGRLLSNWKCSTVSFVCCKVIKTKTEIVRRITRWSNWQGALTSPVLVESSHSRLDYTRRKHTDQHTHTHTHTRAHARMHAQEQKTNCSNLPKSCLHALQQQKDKEANKFNKFNKIRCSHRNSSHKNKHKRRIRLVKTTLWNFELENAAVWQKCVCVCMSVNGPQGEIRKTERKRGNVGGGGVKKMRWER